ncbi:MAG: hypothetical protein OQK61_07690 [Ignavibacteriaceae bacterium]|nr:hypothetical protein [Ignavibacteriaceae bacterium]
MIHSRDTWEAIAESFLPPCKEVVQRNRAITAQYAQLYLEYHELFKWAGMAAFASSQVGVALAFVELMQTPGRMMETEHHEKPVDMVQGIGDFLAGAARSVFSLPFMLYDVAAKNILLNDLEEIRKGNNAIYKDIAWAHIAYAKGGLAEIEGNISDNEREFLLSGFRQIDEGAALMKTGEDHQKASALIREGNSRLLRHEQVNTLGPVFQAISPQGHIVVSFGSELNFGEAASPGHCSRASFADHFGYFEVLSGCRDVTDTQHRWQWIEENVLPVWYAVDDGFGRWSGTERVFRSMAEGEANMLQQIAHFASTLSFLR